MLAGVTNGIIARNGSPRILSGSGTPADCTVRVCTGKLAESLPIGYTKVRLDGVTVSGGGVLHTVSATGICRERAPGIVVTTTFPLYWPSGRFLGSTVIVVLPAVPGGLTPSLSQPLPESMITVRAKPAFLSTNAVTL